MSQQLHLPWSIARLGDELDLVGPKSVAAVTIASVTARAGYPVLLTDTTGAMYTETPDTVLRLRRRPLAAVRDQLDLTGDWGLWTVWPEDSDEPVTLLQSEEAKAVYEWLGPELRIEVTRWYPGTAYDLGNWRYTGTPEFLTGDEDALTADIRRDVLTVADWLYEQE